MYYGPHRLEIRRVSESRDTYNRTVAKDEWWEEVGPCRCDDSTTAEMKDSNGRAFVPKYHIVADHCDVKAGDYVRAMNGDVVRGEGEVKRVIMTNYLSYVSIYV